MALSVENMNSEQNLNGSLESEPNPRMILASLSRNLEKTEKTTPEIKETQNEENL